MKPWKMSLGEMKREMNEALARLSEPLEKVYIGPDDESVNLKYGQKIKQVSKPSESGAVKVDNGGKFEFLIHRKHLVDSSNERNIDELSLDKVAKYRSKSLDAIKNHAGAVAVHDARMQMGYGTKEDMDDKLKNMKALDKRKKGYKTALDKIAGFAKVPAKISEAVQNDLLDSMQKVHASNFIFYWKAHTAHWNVEGDDFVSFHKFFGDLYEEVYEAVDTIAEHIRVLDVYPESNLSKIISEGLLTDFISSTNGEELSKDLEEANEKLIAILIEAQKIADEYNDHGLASFLEDRIDIHGKHGWMLRAISKGEKELGESEQLDEISSEMKNRYLVKALETNQEKRQKGIKKAFGESRFEKLEKKLSDKGIDDPAALAAWIGRKKYGKEKFAKMSHPTSESNEEGKNFETPGQKKMYDDFVGKSQVHEVPIDNKIESFRDFMLRKSKDLKIHYKPSNDFL